MKEIGKPSKVMQEWIKQHPISCYNEITDTDTRLKDRLSRLDLVSEYWKLSQATYDAAVSEIIACEGRCTIAVVNSGYILEIDGFYRYIRFDKDGNRR